MSREKLVALEKLQDLDLIIDDLVRQADAFPARKAELEGAFHAARAAADVARAKLADNERARRSVETQLSDEKEKVKKWEARLPQLKHPREFAALQREVEGAKRANAAAEEELNRLKAAAVELKAALDAKDQDAAARETELQAETGGLANQEAELRDRVASLKADRDSSAGVIDRAVLTKYESLRKRRPGRILVAVNGESCGGCHRKLLPLLVHKVIVGDSVEQCPSCLRLLYMPADQAATGT